MKETERFSLPKPEGQDFADGALQLQALAEAVDIDLSNLQQSLTNSLRTPAYIGVSTATVTIASTEVLQLFDDATNIFNLTGFTTVYNNGFANPFTIPEQGSYLFGCYGVVTCDGAVNANTLRRFIIAASVPNGPQFTSQKSYSYWEQTLQAPAASSYLCAAGTFDYQVIGDARPKILWWGFEHDNTSSTVTMATGALWWVIKISDLAS